MRHATSIVPTTTGFRPRLSVRPPKNGDSAISAAALVADSRVSSRMPRSLPSVFIMKSAGSRVTSEMPTMKTKAVNWSGSAGDDFAGAAGLSATLRMLAAPPRSRADGRRGWRLAHALAKTQVLTLAADAGAAGARTCCRAAVDAGRLARSSVVITGARLGTILGTVALPLPLAVYSPRAAASASLSAADRYVDLLDARECLGSSLVFSRFSRWISFGRVG